MYRIIEEASEAQIAIEDNLNDAIEKAESMQGKYLVLDENDNIVYDSMPGISFKF